MIKFGNILPKLMTVSQNTKPVRVFPFASEFVFSPVEQPLHSKLRAVFLHFQLCQMFRFPAGDPLAAVQG